MARSVGPTRQRQCGRLLLLSTACFCRPMLRLGVGRAAMFVEPAITEIEEMVRLNHGRTVASDRWPVIRGPNSRVNPSDPPDTDHWSLTTATHRVAVPVRRTGTFVRRPFL